MENKAKLSETTSIGREWKDLSVKTFHQVNKKLGKKGRIFVGVGILLLCVIGGIFAHMGDRYERNFDRNYYGNMMDQRDAMMGDYRINNRQILQRQGRGISVSQGCAQQATVEIDPNNPNIKVMRSQIDCPFADETDDNNQGSVGFFDAMETRMQQIFGGDKRGNQEAPAQITVPATGLVATGTTQQ